LVVPYTALPPEYHSSLPLRDALPIYSVDKSATYGRSDGTIGVRASLDPQRRQCRQRAPGAIAGGRAEPLAAGVDPAPRGAVALRSEEHTSELQSRENLVCRLLLEKKK